MADQPKSPGSEDRRRARVSRHPPCWCCCHKRADAARFARVGCALCTTFSAFRPLVRSALLGPGFRLAAEAPEHLAQLCARTTVRPPCYLCEHCSGVPEAALSRSRPCRPRDPALAEFCRLPLQRHPVPGPEPWPTALSPHGGDRRSVVTDHLLTP